MTFGARVTLHEIKPLNRHTKGKATTLFVMPSSGVAERVAEILREYEVNVRLTSFVDKTNYSDSSNSIVTAGKLSGGFELPSARLVVHVEGDLFDEAAEPALERRSTAIKREKKRRARGSQPLVANPVPAVAYWK